MYSLSLTSHFNLYTPRNQDDASPVPHITILDMGKKLRVAAYESYAEFCCAILQEILSVLLAIGLLAAISAILVSHDGKPTPDWGTQLNLNALLALLSTILRALLVIIVSQIICQQKWEWYSKKRMHPLSDLQKFDYGSRSSLGALLLMPTVMLKDAVSLVAAAVLVVSFLIGPFVQQASRTTTCLFPATGLGASLPYAHYIPRRGGLSLGLIGNGASVLGSEGDPLPDTAVAILSSITAPNGTENQIRGDCSTGTCTFRHADPGNSFPSNPLTNNSSTHSTVAMCDKCIDVSSLVSSQYSSTTRQKNFTLPNGAKIKFSGSPGTFAMISPSTDLQWLGNLLTPELRAMSRWAYVNTTFFTVQNTTSSVEQRESTAAVCVLYPCLRTYIASITNNQLLEEEVSSQTMQISVQHDEQVASSADTELSTEEASAGSIGLWGGRSALIQYEAHYAAVKSPCQLDGQVYDETLNTTALTNATSLSLYDYSDPQRYMYRNVTAPESCIYRHDVGFVKAISTILNEEIFNGSCSWYKVNRCGKTGDGDPALSNLGVKAMLETFIEGERLYSNVDSWFKAFAKSMTNRFRFQYGGAAFNASLPLFDNYNLPVGQVQGVAWQTETCVSAHRDWLILPICLTAVTTLLMLWTILANWRTRRSRPVWKDSILPLLFYRHNFDSESPSDLPWGRDSQDKTRIMETSELEQTSSRIPVKLRWPASEESDHSFKKGDTSAIALQDVERMPMQRSSREAGAESLLANTDTEYR